VARRVALGLLVIFMQYSAFSTKMLTFFIIQFIYFVYTIRFMPFESKKEQFVEVLTEVVIFQLAICFTCFAH
jgi:hypothetical protein